mmetsp:Transcript_14495/g.15178  ORF Transcript_14495/g.15178 Transcript_14495/m.15178 type:complete len:653 (-) Transcript_14495:59-2017(-)
MYSERLNKIINQVCHAWEEQAAEHEAKMRALANSIVSEHEAERFNTQKAFKSALAAKNNEINSLLSECKKLKALLTHIHSENKELQKKLSMANRTIESLRQGMAYDENGMPISKQGFIGSGDDSTVYASDDSLSVGGGMGMSGIGGDYYGGLDDLSGSHSQLGNWSQQPPPSNRQQQQSQSQQSHLFPRGINSPDSDIYGYNPGVGSIGLGGGVGVGGNGVSGGGDINRGYFADNEPSIRGPPPSSLSDGRGSGGGGGGGIGGLFTSSSTSSSSSIPSVSTSSNQHFPSRGVPSHGLVYGGRFVLESAGEDPPSLYPRDDYQVDRSGSYDLTRADRESDEYNQHSGYLDDPSSQIPGQSQSQVNAANATTSKRLSPSAPSFMPGSTSLQGNLNKNNVTQLGSVGNSPVTRSNSSSSQSNNNNNNINHYPHHHPEKYSMIERIISKDIEDQVITQLTLRMGGEPINVVVYWLAKEECLRINAFCFQGSEEYTFNINQSTIEQLFSGVPHLQSAHMQSPYLLHNLVERMKIEKMRRKDALAVMMKLNNISNDKVAAKLARNGGLDTASVESILSGTPINLPSNVSANEEDRVRVITLRSITTNALVMCCIAKVRNSHWEQLLKAIPKVEHRAHSIEEFLAKPAPKKAASRHSVY